MNGIGWAIKQMQHGGRVTRSGWNGKSMWLMLQMPDADSKMTLPYIYMRTAQGDLVPWLASQTDILATDWSLAEHSEIYPGKVFPEETPEGEGLMDDHKMIWFTTCEWESLQRAMKETSPELAKLFDCRWHAVGVIE